MGIKVYQGDITSMKVDAIVNAANRTLLGGGGVDGAIHRAAGKGLLKECEGLNGCETGEAKITGGYDLPAKHVIHTVGPVWHGGDRGEKKLLENAYRNSLKIAIEKGLKTVAFPAISTGIYGYPKGEAAYTAVRTVREVLEENGMWDQMTVFLVAYSSKDAERYEKIAEEEGVLEK